MGEEEGEEERRGGKEGREGGEGRRGGKEGREGGEGAKEEMRVEKSEEKRMTTKC